MKARSSSGLFIALAPSCVVGVFSLHVILIVSLVWGFLCGVRLQAQSPDPGGGVNLPTVTLMITTDQTVEPSPTTKIAPGRFVINRSGDASSALRVFVKYGGSATAGLDYLAPGDFITLPEGVIGTEVIVSPLDDDLVEGDETVTVTLVEAPTGSVPTYSVDPAFATGRIVIHDNDSIQPTATLDLYSPVDGQTFKAGETIPVQLRAVDPEGYIPRVEFYADQQLIGVSELAFLVAPKPGTPIEHRFDWANAPWGNHILTARASRPDGQLVFSKPVKIAVQVTIKIPVASITVKGFKTSEPNPLSLIAPISFTVQLDPAPVIEARVWLSYDGTAQPDADYKKLPPFVDFKPGQSTAELFVLPLGDELAEGPEIVRASIVPTLYNLNPGDSTVPSRPGPFYIISETAREAMIVIGDDEKGAPEIRLDIVSPASGSSFRRGSGIRIEALGAYTQGELSRGVQFYAGDMLIGSTPASDALRPDILCLPSSHPIEWKDAPAGDHVITAQYELPNGNKVVSPGIKIQVDGSEISTVSVVHVMTREALPDADYVPGYFLFERTGGDTSHPLHVYLSFGGTASPGTDYETVRSIEIPAGKSFATWKPAAIDDKWPEARESIVVRINPLPPNIDAAPWADYKIDPRRGVAEALMYDNDRGSDIATLEWLNPKEGEQFGFGQMIALEVVAVDKLADIRRVEFYDGNTRIGISEHLTKDAVIPGRPRIHRFEWFRASMGGHRLIACALDSEGGTVISKTLEIGVTELPPRITLAVTVTDPIASEMDPSTGKPDPAVFTIRRVSGPRDVEVPVFYSIAPGSRAENGVDFEKLSGRVILPKGADHVDVVINPIPDKALEGDEGVVFSLDPPACIEIIPAPVECYITREPTLARAIIRDFISRENEPPSVAIVEPTSGESVFLGQAVTIVAEAMDRDGVVTLLEYFAGNEKLGEIIVPAVNVMPGRPQPPIRIRFPFRWERPGLGRHVVTVKATDNDGASSVSKPLEILVVAQDDLPTVSLTTWDAHAVEPLLPGELNTATFQLQRTGPTDKDLMVWLNIEGSAISGKDYEALPSTVVIPAGRSSVFLTVTPIGDEVREESETVIVSVIESPNMGPRPVYHVGKSGRGTAVIADSGWIFPGGPGYCIPLPNGMFHVCFAATVDGPYRWEMSEDLLVWRTLGYSEATAGAVHWVDDTTNPSAKETRRFYRSVPVNGAVDSGNP